jgi:excisionase family DNA binding protein
MFPCNLPSCSVGNRGAKRPSAAPNGAVPDSPLQSPKQVAESCGLSTRAIYRAIDRGELRATRLCGRLRVRSADVQEWIELNTLQSVPTLEQPATVAAPASQQRGSLRKMLRNLDGGVQ